MKSVDEQRGYAGPIKTERLATQHFCGHCRVVLTSSDRARNAWLCLSCADEGGGYSQRLEIAQREARDRCSRAYPVTQASQQSLGLECEDEG